MLGISAVTLPDNFGDSLMIRRTSKRISQTELAARSKVSSRMICEIETGKRKKVGKLIVVKIALGLEITDYAAVRSLLLLAGIDVEEFYQEFKRNLIRLGYLQP